MIEDNFPLTRKYTAVMGLINQCKGEPQFIEMLHDYFWPEELN